jgi:SAM-dependent methyltransferase
VQIAEYPADMARFYRGDYYSLADGDAPSPRGLARIARRLRDRYLASGLGLIGRVIAYFRPHNRFVPIARIAPRRDIRILDVGCGRGALLRELHGAGFTNLTGVDPFIRETTEPYPGLTIYKSELEDLAGRFDLVMLNHSLEHMPRQAHQVGHVARLLAPDGRAIIRVPLGDSVAREKYQEFWFQWDAPRHFYLHSVGSVRRLLEGAGLILEEVIWDSDGTQFAISEMYRQNFTLDEATTSMRATFSTEQIAQFDREAGRLNASGRGDQATFYARKPA